MPRKRCTWCAASLPTLAAVRAERRALVKGLHPVMAAAVAAGPLASARAAGFCGAEHQAAALAAGGPPESWPAAWQRMAAGAKAHEREARSVRATCSAHGFTFNGVTPGGLWKATHRGLAWTVYEPTADALRALVKVLCIGPPRPPDDGGAAPAAQHVEEEDPPAAVPLADDVPELDPVHVHEEPPGFHVVLLPRPTSPGVTRPHLVRLPGSATNERRTG